MSKNKDQKRKAQLAARAKNESFRFQVEGRSLLCGPCTLPRQQCCYRQHGGEDFSS